MKKLKIAFLSVFYPFRGGIAQFNNELYKAFEINCGDSCEVKAFNFSRQYPALLFPGKTQMVSPQDPNPQIDAVPLLDSINPFSFIKTVKTINDFEPDVVITSYWMPFFAPSLGTVLRYVKGRKIALLHNVIPHEKGKLDDVLNKYYLKPNNDFIVLSDTVKGQLKSYKPQAKYLQVTHPLYRHFGEKLNKETAQQQLGIPKGKKVVLFFGFIRKYKGLDLLIDALVNCDENTVLLIAGESYEAEEELDHKISKLGLEKRVFKNVRYIPDEEVKLFFSASDICALPYRSATQSGIASIAKHFELPMVVTPVGELPNEVKHGFSGYVCEDVSVKAIQEGVENVLGSREEYVRNQQQDNKDNSFERFAERVVEYLRLDSN